MKFTITFDELIPNDGFFDELDKKGTKEYIKTLPNAKIRKDWEEGSTMFDCKDTFEANSIEEAKEIVKNNYLKQYNGAEYFDCKDEKGNTVFTEEDL